MIDFGVKWEEFLMWIIIIIIVVIIGEDGELFLALQGFLSQAMRRENKGRNNDLFAGSNINQMIINMQGSVPVVYCIYKKKWTLSTYRDRDPDIDRILDMTSVLEKYLEIPIYQYTFTSCCFCEEMYMFMYIDAFKSAEEK